MALISFWVQVQDLPEAHKPLHALPVPSLPSPLPTSPSLTLLQAPWLPCCSSNTPGSTNLWAFACALSSARNIHS